MIVPVRWGVGRGVRARLRTNYESNLQTMELVEILSGVERRRRWTREEKLRIVEEAFTGEMKPSDVARRYGLHPNQVFAWRRAFSDAAKAEAAAAFLPVTVGVPVEAPTQEPAIGQVMLLSRRQRAGSKIEIVLGEGRKVVVGSDVDAQALGRVLDVLAERPR